MQNLKDEDLRKVHTVPLSLSENLTEALPAINEERVPERTIHPLFRNMQQRSPHGALTNTAVVAAKVALGGTDISTQQNEKHTTETSLPNGNPRAPNGTRFLNPPAEAPKALNRVLKTIALAEEIAKVPAATMMDTNKDTIEAPSFNPHARAILGVKPKAAPPRAIQQTKPSQRPHGMHGVNDVAVPEIKITNSPESSDHRETIESTVRRVPTVDVLNGKEPDSHNFVHHDPSITDANVNMMTESLHDGNENRDDTSSIRNLTLHEDCNSGPGPIPDVVRPLSLNRDGLPQNRDVRSTAEEGFVETISTPGNAESGALEIDFVEYVVVNEPNTHIGAIVAKSQQNSSTTQVRLWEAKSGKLIWHRNLPSDASITLRPSFGADGKYFCYQDGHSRIMTVQVMNLNEKIQLKLPVEQDSSLESFEWNLTTQGLKAFAIHSNLERVALAVPEASGPGHIKVKSVVNRHLPSGIVKYIDQVFIPQESELAVSFSTELLYTPKDHLFIVWHDSTRVVITCFNFVQRQIVSQVEKNWNTPREFIHGVRASGVISIDSEECLIVTVPAKLQHQVLGRFRAPLLGRKTIILAASGKEIATLSKGSLWKQCHDIIVSEGKIMRCRWKEDKLRVEIWEHSRFSLVCLFTFGGEVPAAETRVAYRRGKLSLLSPDGKFQFLVANLKA